MNTDGERPSDPALKLMGILAHPDDETLGNGGVLARYAAEGVETYVVTATRGERGWVGPEDENPGLAALGQLREQELRAAVNLLGVRRLDFLDYVDGDLDQADPDEAIARIVGHVRRVRPHVVLTFGHDGAYGHPDHIAICQFATAAVVRAADPAYFTPDEYPPHAVSKLYYMAPTKKLIENYQFVFGDLVMTIDGVERRGEGWPDWSVTTLVDAGDHWRTAWEAVQCHRSQLPTYDKLMRLSDEGHEQLWRWQGYYRAYSLVNGGRKRETDLFEGLRP